MADVWRSIPEVLTAWQVNRDQQIFGGLELELWGDRERSQDAIIAEAQSKYAQIAGLEIYTFPWPALPGIESGLPINFVIASTDDYEALDRVAQSVLTKAQESGLFIFANKSLRYSRPELNIQIDRKQAAALGIDMADIAATLQVLLGESEINRFALG